MKNQSIKLILALAKNRNQTRDPAIIVAVFYQLSYQANCELVITAKVFHVLKSFIQSLQNFMIITIYFTSIYLYSMGVL